MKAAPFVASAILAFAVGLALIAVGMTYLGSQVNKPVAPIVKVDPPVTANPQVILRFERPEIWSN